MWLVGGVFAPRLLVFVTKLLVKQGSRPFVAAVSVESIGVVGHCPVRCLVFDQVSALQPRERSTDCALIEADLGCNSASFERAIFVGDKKPEYLIGDRCIFEFFLARVLEGVLHNFSS